MTIVGMFAFARSGGGIRRFGSWRLWRARVFRLWFGRIVVRGRRVITITTAITSITVTINAIIGITFGWVDTEGMGVHVVRTFHVKSSNAECQMCEWFLQ